MRNIVIVGSQWGDEGKGKIVDWLSDLADVIIRFQGGHNAGHTLVIDGVTFKLRLLPSGIVRKNKISIIGNGVVVDPWALLEEIKEIRLKGVNIDSSNLIISESATLILPFHSELDEIRENTKGNFMSQRRCVTKEDFKARILSLPAKFGAIAKVEVVRQGFAPELQLQGDKFTNWKGTT